MDVPPYLLGLGPTLYSDRYHLSKYILQLAIYPIIGKRACFFRRRWV
nr:MAG TPA: hypothetical protein [Inoviridae sp.]